MDEQYVSLETAKMLKEIGFIADITSRYVKEEPDDEEWCLYYDGIKGFNYNIYDDTVVCPTQALAVRWLREKYALHVFSHYSFVVEKFSYMIQIIDAKQYDNLLSCASYVNPEEAMEVGLQKAIEMIKNSIMDAIKESRSHEENNV